MTYVAILRSAQAPDRDVVRLERGLVARIGRECPTAKWIASSGTAVRSACIDVLEAPDEATAAAIAEIARTPGVTEAAICREIPWELFGREPE